jgi:AcrR family transcriptional regulator
MERVLSGRPRDPELEKRLLAAAWSLLTSEGYDALTLTKVAAAADAHRTDVYRRWSSKTQLVVDVVAEHLPPIPATDTGTLLGDLRAHVAGLALSWSAPWMDGLVGALGDLRYDPDAELAFLNVGLSRGQGARDALRRAVERGELPGMPVDEELRLLGDLLEGMLMHRRMIARQALDEDFLDAVAARAHRLAVSAVTA